MGKVDEIEEVVFADILKFYSTLKFRVNFSPKNSGLAMVVYFVRIVI